MPIFGLVCLASWVGCFFPSSQDLLKPPEYLPDSSVAQLPLRPTIPQLTMRRSTVSQCVSLCTQMGSVGGFSQVAYNPQRLVSSITQDFNQRLLSVNNPLSLVKTLFAGFHRIAEAPRTTSVVIEPLTRQNVVAPNATSGQCISPQTIRQPKAKAAPIGFQVKVGDAVVAEVQLRQHATQVARRLEKLLRNPSLDASQIQPAMVNGLAAGKVGEQVLFTVNRDIATHWHCNAERLAIHWVNNLRSALGATPLLLPQAQKIMHRLQETGEQIEGTASWYGPYFHGRQTATGETFDENEFTAAHPTLPFDTYLRVTNLNNGKSVIVRVNDRGPYVENRTLDLSHEAARSIESEAIGVVPIQAEIMHPTFSQTASGQRIARL